MVADKKMMLRLKSGGYLISIASVLMLGAVTWGGTDGSPRLRLCLIGGIAAAIIGMLCRWVSYLYEEAGESGAVRGETGADRL